MSSLRIFNDPDPFLSLTAMLIIFIFDIFDDELLKFNRNFINGFASIEIV